MPFCAPMQLYHGLVSRAGRASPTSSSCPMLRQHSPRRRGATVAVCPIVQAQPRHAARRTSAGAAHDDRLAGHRHRREGLDSATLPRDAASASRPSSASNDDRLARGAGPQRVAAQDTLRRSAASSSGRRALDFCREHELVPVVVLGRAYTIYNEVLNSNVPAILREQGAIAIPVDCYPVRRRRARLRRHVLGLRPAQPARRPPGPPHAGRLQPLLLQLLLRPRQLHLHFYAYVMEGKPFAIIETDGHSGDAGTKTRVEAFLHCVREDLKGLRQRRRQDPSRLRAWPASSLTDIRRARRAVLIPRMGPAPRRWPPPARPGRAGRGAAACPTASAAPRPAPHLGQGVRADDHHAGQPAPAPRARHDSDERFVLLHARPNGPCRFGVYNLAQDHPRAARAGGPRAHLVAAPDATTSRACRRGSARWSSPASPASACSRSALRRAAGGDPLRRGRPDLRPLRAKALTDRLEAAAPRTPRRREALLEATTGKLFGCPSCSAERAAELRAIRSQREVPTVLVVGEIYVRCDPFANDFIVASSRARHARALRALHRVARVREPPRLGARREVGLRRSPRAMVRARIHAHLPPRRG